MRRTSRTLNNFNIFFFAITVNAILFFSCNKNESPETPLKPAVSNVTTSTGALSGSKNTVITINGANFITDLSKIEVKVNGKSCEVLSATSTAISAKIPPACGTGLIELFIDGSRYEGPVFNFTYTYALTSVTNGIAGVENGPLATAKFDEIVSVSIDGNNNMFIGQYTYSKVRKINSDGIANLLIGTGTRDHVDGSAATAQFKSPEYCSPGPDGNLYVADETRIRKVDAAGNVSTLYTSDTYLMGIKAMPGGIYICFDRTIAKISYNGSLVWQVKSKGRSIVDGDTSIAQFTAYGNIEVDSSEQNIYFGNRLTYNTPNNLSSSQLRKFNIPAKTIITIAGTNTRGSADGPALQSTFFMITDIRLDKAGNLWIADGFNHKIRLLQGGVVSTIIGSSGPGDIDGDVAVGKINYPTGIYFNSSGHLYIACTGNNKLKRLIID